MEQLKQIDIPFQKESFISGVGFDEKGSIFGITCSDDKMYFYLKGKVRIEHIKTLTAPCMQQRIWYL